MARLYSPPLVRARCRGSIGSAEPCSACVRRSLVRQEQPSMARLYTPPIGRCALPGGGQYSVRSGAPFGGGLYWYSQVSVRVLPPLRRYRRMSIWSVESSGGTRSNMAR